ncbi:MAG: DEAD/DEAH box helicase family protein [Candidatus Methanomethylophilaceae archaeon]|nr:DEAD/DEAH box helicase family protein [Candidatus Methanomethylophilaceae archaeon]
MESRPNSVYTNRTLLMGDGILDSLSRAVSVDMAVSFLQESGLARIIGGLRDALSRGVRIRLVTGTYLNITNPFVLEELLDLEGDIEVRIFTEDVSFHPKAYIFHHADPVDDEAYIGSSNLSHSALTTGVEWNYRLRRSCDRAGFTGFQEEFDHLFSERSVPLTRDILSDYKRSWRRPRIGTEGIVPGTMVPRGPQITALNSLKRTRDEGMDRALLVMATGVGKTFVAAKDSQAFGSVLFVAHRREILVKAMETFRIMHPGKSAGLLVDGHEEIESDLLFASVQSLSRDGRLGSIDPERYEYMVVDEFHHATADTYSRIIGHFRPKFMLGLTATPERMDDRDVYAICGYNVPFEIGMPDAIRFGSLVPFSYYGIHDDTDYDRVRRSNGRYVEGDLEDALNNELRAKSILDNYHRFPSKRALAFCSSIGHARFMHRFFMDNGVESRWVTSAPDSDDRGESVRELESGTARIVFTVDMFNEGVDIPSIDMVMFLRPTESGTVFMQQLGRGLRTSEGKERLTVLDFIGNYRNVDRIPGMLTGQTDLDMDPPKIIEHTPPGCFINFDLGSLDILRRMAERSSTITDRVDSEFDRIMDDLGRIPSRVELFNRFDRGLYPHALKKNGPFRDHIGYLVRRGLADPAISSFDGNVAGEFIRMVENTSMQKLYKMPVLSAFLSDHGYRMSVTRSQLVDSFKEFYSRDGNRVDLVVSKSRKDPASMTDKQWIDLIYKMPVHFLCKPGSESARFLSESEGVVSLSGDLETVMGLDSFREQVRDAIEYRTVDFKYNRYREMNTDG